MTTLEDASFLGYDTVLIEDGYRYHVAGLLRAGRALQRQTACSALSRSRTRCSRHSPRRRRLEPTMTLRHRRSTRSTQRLSALGIELPDGADSDRQFRPVPAPRQSCLSRRTGLRMERRGALRRQASGCDYDLADGQQAARVCALNLLAALRLPAAVRSTASACCIRLGASSTARPQFNESRKSSMARPT